MLPPFPQPPVESVSRWARLRTIVIRWLISTLAIFIAVWVVPGIDFVGPGWQFGIIALVFGLVNVALRPILTALTCPLIILTLGLFGLVINAVLLTLTAQIAIALNIQLTVDGFWSAVGGGLVISLISLILNQLADTGNPNMVVRVNYKNMNDDSDT